MSMSLYQVSVPVFVKTLTNLKAVLQKAKAHALEHKIEEAAFVNARLYPDMLPLSRQVQITSDVARGCTARLAGEIVSAVSSFRIAASGGCTSGIASASSSESLVCRTCQRRRFFTWRKARRLAMRNAHGRNTAGSWRPLRRPTR